MRNKTIGLLGLALVGNFVSGCGSLPSEWSIRPINNSSCLQGKATMVVPIKGAPISLQDSTFLPFLFGGFVGVAIQEGVDQPKRAALGTNMAGQASGFCPEKVLGEECVDLLKRSSWASGKAVTLYKGLETMHGAGPLVERETRVFKSTLLKDSDAWKNAYTKWITGGPVHCFKTNEVGPVEFVSLELTGTSVIKGVALTSGLFLRLMDSVSGKSLASGYADEEFKVHPLEKPEDLDAFIADYRRCARHISETLLKKLNLLP